MFGTFRLLLAGLVVVSHLSGDQSITHFGLYAVRAFFVLSGFVITSALHEVYAFDARRFWVSRLLKLMPLYYLVCLATAAVTLAIPAGSNTLGAFWHDPNLHDVLQCILLVGLQFDITKFCFVVPIWSLAVELTLYALLFCFVARGEKRALFCLIVGMAFHVVCLFDDTNWTSRYFPALAAVMPFSYGTLVYFWSRHHDIGPGPAWLAPLLAAWLGNMALGAWLGADDHIFVTGFYGNSILSILLVWCLARLRPGPLLNRIDRAIGELSYPIFLVHWLVGFVVATVILSEHTRSWRLVLVATPFILLAATGLALVNRFGIEPLRARLRRGEPLRSGRHAPAFPFSEAAAGCADIAGTAPTLALRG